MARRAVANARGVDAPIPGSRVDALDGLRGCLALIVALTHGTDMLYPAIAGHGLSHFGVDRWIQRSPFALLLSADFAVRIFFVHSGFVLALKYFRTRRPGWPGVMFIRRSWRLGLPVFASTIVAWCCTRVWPLQSVAVKHATGLAGKVPPDHAVSYGDALLAGLYRTMWLGHPNLPGAWWTMPVELYCSLALLACLVIWNWVPVPVRRIAVGGYALLIAALVLADKTTPRLNYESIDNATRLVALLSPTFLFGAFLAWLWARDPEAFRTFALRNRGPAFVIAIGALIVGVFPRTLDPFVFGYKSLLEIGFLVAAAVVLTAVLAWPVLQRFFELPVCAWLGRISFSLYLLHLAVQQTFMSHLFTGLLDHGLPYNVAAVGSLVAGLALSMALAHVFARTVDRLALNAGKRALYRAFGLVPR
jgi:peptidoglycan/LPS O-acetylase OafA/YrhL